MARSIRWARYLPHWRGETGFPGRLFVCAQGLAAMRLAHQWLRMIFWARYFMGLVWTPKSMMMARSGCLVVTAVAATRHRPDIVTPHLP
jgi:hypothetical protein